MTLDKTKIKDWRSTGRREGRRTLYRNWVPYECVDCAKTSRMPPKDAPKHFQEIWPEELREVSTLQVDHEDKDYTNNELTNLNWRCASCHKIHDLMTEKGVSTVQVESFLPDLSFLED